MNKLKFYILFFFVCVLSFNLSLFAQTNVALNKIVTASSTAGYANGVYATNYNPAFITDGIKNNSSKRWDKLPTVALPQWVEIDLESSTAIDGIGIVCGGTPAGGNAFSDQYGLKGFEFQRWNGTEWVTIGGETNNQALGFYQRSFPIVTTTKVRLYITKGNAGTASAGEYLRVAEIEVYSGSSYQALPVLSTALSDIQSQSNLSIHFSSNLNSIIISNSNQNEKIEKIQVLNISGQNVYSSTGNLSEQNVITLSENRVAGVYIVKIVKSGKVYKQKIVVD
jgi:hypothetical protein